MTYTKPSIQDSNTGIEDISLQASVQSCTSLYIQYLS
jgi:hypothetical protein